MALKVIRKLKVLAIISQKGMYQRTEFKMTNPFTAFKTQIIFCFKKLFTFQKKLVFETPNFFCPNCLFKT